MGIIELGLYSLIPSYYLLIISELRGSQIATWQGLRSQLL